MTSASPMEFVRLPCIRLNVVDETLLLNLVAFEQSHDLDSKAISFLIFLNSLIDTGKDPAALREEGIISGLEKKRR